MDKFQIFKVNAKGKVEGLPTNTKSLHHQRAVFLVDTNNQRILTFKGKNLKEKLVKTMENVIEKLLSTDYNGFTLLDIPQKDHKSTLSEILEKKPVSKKTKKSQKKAFIKKTNGNIPRTPVVPKTISHDPKPLGDMKQEGPEIKKFQISYIPDNNIAAYDSLDIGLGILKEVQSFFKGNIEGDELRKKLNQIIDNVING